MDSTKKKKKRIVIQSYRLTTDNIIMYQHKQ